MPKYVYSVASSPHLSLTHEKHAEAGHSVALSGNNPGVSDNFGPLAMIWTFSGGPTTRPSWTAYRRRYDAVNGLNSPDSDSGIKYIPKLLPSQEVHFITPIVTLRKMLKMLARIILFLRNIKTAIIVLDRLKNKQGDNFVFSENMFNLTGAAVSSSGQDGFISRFMLSVCFNKVKNFCWMILMLLVDQQII